MNAKLLGLLGENMAKHFLSEKDFKIVASNYRFKKWEIDIIAEKDNTIVFIEVKTRQNDYLGEPWRAVTRTKQRQIIRVAQEYLVHNNISQEARFDVISILHNPERSLNKIEHIEDAFYSML